MAFLRYKTGLTSWFRAAATFAERDQSLSGVSYGTGWADVLKNNDLPNVVGNPRMRFNVVNGRPAIQFDGASAVYSNNTAINFISAAAGTVFAVYSPATPTTSNSNLLAPCLWVQQSGPNNAYGMAIAAATSGTRLDCINTDTTVGTVGVLVNLSSTDWQIGVWRHGSSILSGTKNDETGGWGTAAAGNSASLAFPIGVGKGAAGTSNSQYFTGYMAELLFFNTALTTPNMAAVLNYLRAEYFSPAGNIVSPLTRADALEQSRDVASRMLWFTRQPRMMATVQAPAYLLDAELFSNVGVATPLGPSVAGSSAPGWPNALWARQPMRLYGVEYNLDSPLNVRLKLGDMRQFACNYWESAHYQRAADEQRQGGAVMGRVVRSYSRDSNAWIEDPEFSGVFQVTQGVEKVAFGGLITAPTTDRKTGLLLELPASNYMLRSSFISQLTGLTAPTAQTGASVAATSSTPVGMLFNSGITPYCLHLTGPNPSTSADYLEIWPATVGISTGFGPNTPKTFIASVDWLSTDPNSLTGQPGWSLQRGNDSHWYDASGRTWTSTSQVVNIGFDSNYYNPLTTGSFTTYSAFRSVTRFNTSSGTGTLTFRCGIPRNSVAGRSLWIFHAELIGAYDATSSGTVSGYDPMWVSSRIVTDTSRASRSADNLRYYDATSSGGGVIPPYAGTILFRYTPQGTQANFWPTTSGPGTLQTLVIWICGETGAAGSSGPVIGSNSYRYMTFTAASSAYAVSGLFAFGQATTSGSAEATIRASLIAGAETPIALRYCSSSGGELGLTANTMDIFVSGTKGTSIVPAVKLGVYAPFYWSNVVLASSAGTIITPGGTISDIQFRPYVMTDAEIAAWSL